MKIFLSAVAYVLIVFPLALVWHIGLFRAKYDTFGYFDGDPSVPIGLLTIVLQGIFLALIYRCFRAGRAGLDRAFRFAGLLGCFFWTSHVLALVAKQNVPNTGGFVLMETGYLVLQFGLYALALGLIYRDET